MKPRLSILSAVAACFALAALPAAAQVPADFSLIASSGQASPGGERQGVEIAASGAASFVGYRDGDGPGSARTDLPFQVSSSDMTRLWQAIEANGFFALAEAYSDPLIHDRTFASVSIRANGTTHRVRTENVAVASFDAVVVVINELTPGSFDLVYDTTPAPTWTERSICEIAGKTDARGYAIADAAGPKDNFVSAFAAAASTGDGHAGTTAAYHLTLQEAVRRGVVTLEGKGSYFGDKVSIEGDNTTPQEKPEVTVTLNIQFYGPDATAANAAKFKSAVETAWSGKTTTDGRALKVEVNTRVSTATEPPGTAGYHNVEMNSGTARSYVSNFGNFDVNSGSGGGSFGPGDAQVEKMYAHEAGHLMGINDYYEDFEKQPGGKWKGATSGTELTTTQLAERWKEKYSTYTTADLETWLNGITSISTPEAGHFSDLMANLDGTAQTADIDALAAKAGMIIDVKPGDILVNKNEGDQNLLVTHRTQLYVKPGETATLNGLFTACIDAHDGSPDFGQHYDVAPPLSEWSGIEAASALLRLAEYLDRSDLFCGSDYTAQQTIWRITDNSNTSDAAVASILAAAGVEATSGTVFDFPRMTNPNAGSDDTSVLVPYELLVASVAPEGSLVTVGTPVTVTGAIPAPVEGLSYTYAWALTTPSGSGTSLSGDGTLTPSFTPDVRGTYVLTLTLTVRDTGGAVAAEMSAAARAVVYDAWTETFERASLVPSIFRWWRDGTWSITTESSASGTGSARSAVIGGSAESVLETTVSLASIGAIAFTYRVSSERSYDFLRFSVDGAEIAAWSGEVDWTPYEMPLAAGVHVLRWAYTKDGSVDSGSDAAWIDDVFFPLGATWTGTEPADVPSDFALLAAWPNPFNPVTRLAFDLPYPTQARLEVFDAVGRLVRRVAERRYEAGRHEVLFDATDLPSGVYAYRLTAGPFVGTRTFVLLR